MTLRTDVTNTRNHEDLPGPAESGAYVHGFYLEGAGWECGRGGEQGYLTDMILKELHPEVPVIHVTSIRLQERRAAKGNYECPVYVTSDRGPTIVFTAYCRTSDLAATARNRIKGIFNDSELVLSLMNNHWLVGCHVTEDDDEQDDKAIWRGIYGVRIVTGCPV
jgi:hypothetical protein